MTSIPEPCQDPHFVGETGTLFYVDCKVDMSDATETKVFIERPDGTIIEKSASPATYRNSTNFISFILEAGDFNQSGEYEGQAHGILDGFHGWGQKFTIDVEAPISSSSSSCCSSSSSRSSSSSSSSSSSA